MLVFIQIDVSGSFNWVLEGEGGLIGFSFIHSIVWFIISCIVGMGDRGIVSSSGGSLVESSGGRSVRIGVGVGSSGGDELVACGGVDMSEG